MNDDITMNWYQVEVMNTLLDTAANPDYMLFGLVGEVGEIGSLIAKDIRDSDYANNREAAQEFHNKLKKEIGDVLWFVAGVCHVYGWKLDDIAWANIGKLRARQQKGTLQGSGDDR